MTIQGIEFGGRAAAIFLLTASSATITAQAGQNIADVVPRGTEVVWQMTQNAGYDGVVLTVSGPPGVDRWEFPAGSEVFYPWNDIEMTEGSYTYELSMIPLGVGAAVEQPRSATAGRGEDENGRPLWMTSQLDQQRSAGGSGAGVQSGYFRVDDEGSVVDDAGVAE